MTNSMSASDVRIESGIVLSIVHNCRIGRETGLTERVSPQELWVNNCRSVLMGGRYTGLSVRALLQRQTIVGQWFK